MKTTMIQVVLSMGFLAACASGEVTGSVQESRPGMNAQREGNPQGGSSTGAATTSDPSTTTAPSPGASSDPSDPRVPPQAGCADGRTECSGQCIDLNSDANNCGRCGNRCADSQTCSAGVCSDNTSSDRPCNSNADCEVFAGPVAMYCAVAEGRCERGATRIAGYCRPRPDCSNLDGLPRPVCGCDGRTYPSACDAASIGVNVSYAGACDATR